MTLDDLFRELDRDADGALSAEDLQRAARELGWHWPEAPLHALLHLLTLREPLPRQRFVRQLAAVAEDPLGPFGAVLTRGPAPSDTEALDADPLWDPAPVEQLATLLDQLDGEAAAHYRPLLGLEPPLPLQPARAALLIIDPQRAFTAGSWMRSLGPQGPRQVEPIRLAFRNAAGRIRQLRGAGVTAAFTRCPFPPASYDWDEALHGTVDPRQPYFVKPGNSVLWPPTNGFAAWVERLLQRGVDTLVLGGCTLNSCVRVSAIETRERFGERLQVVVDLACCGARLDNYRPSPAFGGRSSVAAAVQEMRQHGVRVVPGV